ncbi:MAG: hypothetical protein GC159_19265 [Phycisphaera sp.]|nr:hypothetical protein [Phycisphaera sp.]
MSNGFDPKRERSGSHGPGGPYRDERPRATEPARPPVEPPPSPVPAAPSLPPRLPARDLRPAYAYDAPPRPQSSLGVTSLLFGLAGAAIFVAVIVWFAVDLLDKPENSSGHDRDMLILGLAVIVAILLHVVGLILGVVALFDTSRRRAMAVVGVCINGLILTLIAMLLIIGANAKD